MTSTQRIALYNFLLGLQELGETSGAGVAKTRAHLVIAATGLAPFDESAAEHIEDATADFIRQQHLDIDKWRIAIRRFTSWYLDGSPIQVAAGQHAIHYCAAIWASAQSTAY